MKSGAAGAIPRRLFHIWSGASIATPWHPRVPSPDIGITDLVTLAEVPMHHGDSFDDLFIGQAIAADAAIFSEDRNTGKLRDSSTLFLVPVP